MVKRDQPVGIVSLLFALSIGFWGTDMVKYFQEGTKARFTIHNESVKKIKQDHGDVGFILEKSLKRIIGREFETPEKLKEKAVLKLENGIKDWADQIVNDIGEKTGNGVTVDPDKLKQYLDTHKDIRPALKTALDADSLKEKTFGSSEAFRDYFRDYLIESYVLVSVFDIGKIVDAITSPAPNATRRSGRLVVDRKKLDKYMDEGNARVFMVLNVPAGQEFTDRQALVEFLTKDSDDAFKFPNIGEAAFQGFAIQKDYVKRVPSLAIWVLTLLAGLAFLADIVCIMWWYAKYVYTIQPTATLVTYFLDFGVCAMFNLAANKWTSPGVFLVAALIGVTLLICRFTNLYHSAEAYDTDRRILRRARNFLLGAGIFTLACLGAVNLGVPQDKLAHFFTSAYLHPGTVAILSLIGIGLTTVFTQRIYASAQIHEQEYHSQQFMPMSLKWPSDLPGELARQISEETRQGLEKFRKLFQGDETALEHNRLRSRVHAEGDLHVQSEILALPSWTPHNKDKKLQASEIRNKARMVGISHWLDDLLDGRGEVTVYRNLKKQGKKLEKQGKKSPFGLTLDNAEKVFEGVYKRAVSSHTDNILYAKLVKAIKESAGVPANEKYLFFSLNRVAMGAALFGPRVKENLRYDLLDTHNTELVKLITAADPWHKAVTELLTRMQARRLGKELLGLTTKTVQEMAMASEDQEVDFALSVLYSLLYAPLLYFHDVQKELQTNEIVVLETFDVDFAGIVSWLEEIRRLILKGGAPNEPRPPDDPRALSRLEQLKMAFHCFKPTLPKLVVRTVGKIYDPGLPEPVVSRIANHRG